MSGPPLREEAASVGWRGENNPLGDNTLEDYMSILYCTTVVLDEGMTCQACGWDRCVLCVALIYLTCEAKKLQ